MMQDEKVNNGSGQVNKSGLQAEISLYEFQLWESQRLGCSAEKLEDLKSTIAMLKKQLQR